MLARLRNLVIATSLALPLALAPVSSDAAVDAFLKIKGQKQGDIQGGVTQKGREGSLEVIAVSHEIISPRDAASGLATGKRTHKPLVVTLALDKASPLLLQAMLTGERLSEATISFVKGKKKGSAETYYEIKLTDVLISGYKFEPNDEGPEESIAISFQLTYKKITWTWNDGGITASDDWESPVAARKTAPAKISPN
jgi:type VI secretion system secreted protein Hcp